MSPQAAQPSWEEVLAAVEADLARSEQLVAPPPGEAALAPAQTRLPALPGHGGGSGPVLPPLTSMPPVPRHLADRIQAARDRVEQLQEALRAELTALDGLRAEQASFAVRAARFATAPRPVAGAAFFDSHV